MSHVAMLARPFSEGPGPTVLKESLETLKFFGFALLIFLAVRILWLQPFTIPSDSMQPLLQKGDYIVVTKYSYGWSRYSIPFHPPLPGGRLFGRTPKRGDVVVFKLPRDGTTDYIKRLIGLPGDRIQMRQGVLHINDRAVPLVDTGRVTPSVRGRAARSLMETLPDTPGPHLTLDMGQGLEGDDTPVFVVPQDHYFVMGDNRDDSLDSRWPRGAGVGFVPADHLVGKAQIILLAWRDGVSVFKPWTWFTHAEPGRFFTSLGIRKAKR